MTKRITAASRTGLVDLVNPDPKTISIEAIAHGLGQINRWNGALELPFSVAQHSILVMELFCRAFPGYRGFALHALLHDAHEAYVGDWTSPVFAALLRVIDHDGFHGKEYERCAWARESLKARFDIAIGEAVGVPLYGIDDDVAWSIHRADRWALAIEWRDFMPNENGDFPHEKPKFAVGKLKSLPPAVAAEKFLEVFHRELELIRRSAGWT